MSLADPIDNLLFEVLERYASDGERAIEEVCAAHPGDAATLRERVEALRRAGLLHAAPEDDAIPDQLGDFKLLRRLGSGGMGVVYLAEQMSLHRKVALKLIKPQHLFFPQSRERFRREVLAIASLHHPGIVPIHTGGEEQGIPFFAMELIAGCTLAEALEELEGRAPEALTGADLAAAVRARALEPTPPVQSRLDQLDWVSACLDITRQLAAALAHAHERGIVHRDVKPSNIAIGLDGKVMLLDFGLTSSQQDDRVTLSGSRVGTLLYMSPEQLRGTRDLDGRTDVYSLGVTLYEMLSLQAPFLGDATEETEARILDGRTDGLRARNRHVAADVETVCLKAMDRDAGRRYASAAAFQADLDNLRHHRPVSARAPGAILRLRRWAQRRPALAASLVLGLLAAVGVPAALLVQQKLYNAEIDAERRTAVANANSYHDVSEFLLQLLEASNPDHAENDLTVRTVLDRTVQRLRDHPDDVPRLRPALLRITGEMYRMLTLYPLAREQLEAAVEACERAADPRPLELFACHNLLANTLAQLGKHAAAIEHFEQAIRFRTQAGGEGWPVARMLAEKASSEAHLRQWGLAEQSLARADELIAGDPDTPDQARAMVAKNRGDVLLLRIGSRSSPETRERDQRRAVAALSEALSLYEGNPDSSQLEIAAVHNSLGLGLRYGKRYDRARDEYGKALAIFRRRLEAGDRSIAICLNNLATVEMQRRDFDSAVDLMRQSVAVLRKTLDEDDPILVSARSNLIGLLHRCGRCEEVVEECRDLLPLQEKVLGPDANVVGYAHAKLGECQMVLGDPPSAEKNLLAAYRILSGKKGDARVMASQVKMLLARLYEVTSRPEQAARWR